MNLNYFRLCLLGFLFALFGLQASAQNVTLSGYMRDAATGEELLGSTVYVTELGTGASTNVYGFYSFTIPVGTYTFVYRYVGYNTVTEVIEMKADLTKNLELGESAEMLQEVEIVGEAQDNNVKQNEMSVVKMDVKQIKTLPVLFGEVDVMKTIQLMPGVMNTGDGGTGLYVRGGGPDQNLILLDEAPIYNASHLLGFFSVFNGDAVKNVELMKGAIPANYGGRLSSVLDVSMNEGNSKEMVVQGGIGLIASRLTIEAPIVKDKGSFIISGRRTYADLFLKASSDPAQNKSKLYFYDINAKANYRFSDKDRIFLSGYVGRDKLGYSDLFGFDWGNMTGTLRWNHLFSNKLFMNTTVVASDYDYKFKFDYDDSEISLKSGIREYNLKTDLMLYPNSKNTVKFGANVMYHQFRPGEFTSDDPGINSQKVDERYAFEYAGYVDNEQKLSRRVTIGYGLRWSGFSALGPGTVYQYDESGEEVIGETEYDKGEIIKTYHGFEPRLSATFLVNEKSSIKGAYNRTRQYIHMLSNAGTSTPTDLWFPSTAVIKPQIGDQYTLGYFRNFFDNMLETSVEVYYKDLQNQIDYKNGADIVLNDDVESELLFGDGQAYGIEFFLKKTRGKFTGWIGYTLSRSDKTIPGINDGEAFPNRYDRTHDVSVVATYKLNDKWTLSGSWVYATGNAVTFPVGKYEYQGQIISLYSERNGYRMPDYHRLDLSATVELKKTDKYESSLNMSVYNAYMRQNAYLINFEENEDNPDQTDAIQVALFSIVPSVTWNFKF